MQITKIILIYIFLLNAAAFAANPCDKFLRPVLPADEDFYVSVESDQDVQKMANSKANENEIREQFRAMVSEPAQSEAATQFFRVILDRSTRKEVGTLSGWIIKSDDASEVLFGYSIHKNDWGKGHATAAVKEMVEEFSNAGIKYFYAAVSQSNILSQRVLEKAGFQFTGKTKLAKEVGANPIIDEPFKVYELTIEE